MADATLPIYRGFKVGDRIVENGNNPDWGCTVSSIIRYGEIVDFRHIPGCPSEEIHPFVRYDDGGEGFSIWDWLHPDTTEIPTIPAWKDESAEALEEVVTALATCSNFPPDFEALSTELIADRQVSSRFKDHLIGYLKEAYGVEKSPLTPDIKCFVNAQANTYSHQGQSEINNICGAIQLAPGRTGKKDGRRVTVEKTPDCVNLNFAQTELLYDSCAFTDVLTGDRISPQAALKRQLDTLAGLPTIPPNVWLVSYDRLIDEKHVMGGRIKERWSVEQGEDAVIQTVEAAQYLNSQRQNLDGYKLVMSCQGVDADQYQRCVEQVLEVCRPDDVLGLGGWCILGKQKRWLPVFWEVCDRVIPIIASSGIQQIHIFGCTWYKPMQGFPVSPLTRLLEACDKHGLSLSVDGRSPIGNALWKSWKQAGATFPYWRHNLAWVKAELATLRDSTETPTELIDDGFRLRTKSPEINPQCLIAQCQHLPTSSPAQAETPKEQLTQDIPPCMPCSTSQGKTSNGQPPFTDGDSQEFGSSNKTSAPLQTTSSWDYQSPTALSLPSLVRTFPSLANVPDFLAIADACFLKASDFCDSKSLRSSSLKTLMDSCRQTKGLPSRRSSSRLDNWGICVPGKFVTGTDTSPKTENESSLWVFTGRVEARLPLPYKKSLPECLEVLGTPVNSVTGKQVDEVFTLRSNSDRAGNANHPNVFVRSPFAVQASHDKSGKGCAVIYRAPQGDRTYIENAPTLRSLSNINGHQAGSGSMKVREIDGETYWERPMTAREYENCMGWESGCTALGITSDGVEIQISETQRKRMCGNGVIPHEITEILENLKPFIEERKVMVQAKQRGIDKQRVVLDLVKDAASSLEQEANPFKVGCRVEAITEIPFGVFPKFAERNQTFAGELGTVIKVTEDGKVSVTWDVGETTYQIDPSLLLHHPPINWASGERFWHLTPQNQGTVLEDLGEGVYKIQLDNGEEKLTDRETIFPIYIPRPENQEKALSRFIGHRIEDSTHLPQKVDAVADRLEFISPLDINLERGSQTRVSKNDKGVKELKEKMESGIWRFDDAGDCPLLIELIQDHLVKLKDQDPFLVKAGEIIPAIGHTRIEAAQQLASIKSDLKMLCRVRQGTWFDVIRESGTSDIESAHPKTASDRSYACLRFIELLLDRYGSLENIPMRGRGKAGIDLEEEWGNAKLAKMYGLSINTVQKLYQTADFNRQIDDYYDGARVQLIAHPDFELPWFLKGIVGALGVVSGRAPKEGLFINFDQHNPEYVHPRFLQKSDAPLPARKPKEAPPLTTTSTGLEDALLPGSKPHLSAKTELKEQARSLGVKPGSQALPDTQPNLDVPPEEVTAEPATPSSPNFQARSEEKSPLNKTNTTSTDTTPQAWVPEIYDVVEVVDGSYVGEKGYITCFPYPKTHPNYLKIAIIEFTSTDSPKRDRIETKHLKFIAHPQAQEIPTPPPPTVPGEIIKELIIGISKVSPEDLAYILASSQRLTDAAQIVASNIHQLDPEELTALEEAIAKAKANWRQAA